MLSKKLCFRLETETNHFCTRASEVIVLSRDCRGIVQTSAKSLPRAGRFGFLRNLALEAPCKQPDAAESPIH